VPIAVSTAPTKPITAPQGDACGTVAIDEQAIEYRSRMFGRLITAVRSPI